MREIKRRLQGIHPDFAILILVEVLLVVLLKFHRGFTDTELDVFIGNKYQTVVFCDSFDHCITIPGEELSAWLRNRE